MYKRQTQDDTTDEEEDVVETVITKRVEEMLPAGLGAEYARCRAEALRNRRHQEGDPAEAPSPRRTARRDQALALQRAYEERQKELQQAASQQYRENRRFRAARVREERERISEGGCALKLVAPHAQLKDEIELAAQAAASAAGAYLAFVAPAITATPLRVAHGCDSQGKYLILNLTVRMTLSPSTPLSLPAAALKAAEGRRLPASRTARA